MEPNNIRQDKRLLSRQVRRWSRDTLPQTIVCRVFVMTNARPSIGRLPVTVGDANLISSHLLYLSATKVLFGTIS